MARIRTVKPEFWRSPSTAQASPWARLLYIAMWNWADDYGRAEWTPRELLGFAFPHDTEPPCTDEEFPSLLAEVAEHFGTVFYVNRGRRFYEIPAWDEHQKTERRAKGRNPHADDPESAPDRAFLPTALTVEGVRGISSAARGSSVAGTGEREQGNRGTGERGEHEEQSAATPLDDIFDTAYDSWPKKVERKKSLEAFKRACKKRDPEDVAADIARFGQAYAATTETQFVPALVVWLNGERWTDQLPQARASQSTAHERQRDRYAANLAVVHQFEAIETDQGVIEA